MLSHTLFIIHILKFFIKFTEYVFLIIYAIASDKSLHKNSMHMNCCYLFLEHGYLIIDRFSTLIAILYNLFFLLVIHFVWSNADALTKYISMYELIVRVRKASKHQWRRTKLNWLNWPSACNFYRFSVRLQRISPPPLIHSQPKRNAY